MHLPSLQAAERRSLPARAGRTFILLLAALTPAVLSAQAVYVPNYTTSNIAGFLVDPSSGRLTAIGGPLVKTGQSPIQALVHPSGKFLYILNAGSGDIAAYATNAPSGVPTLVACPLCVAPSPSGMAVHPAGDYLYVTNQSTGAVTAYAVNTVSGALTITGPPGRTRSPSQLGAPAIDPTGRFLYVPDAASAQVFGFMISPGGTLTPVAGSPFTTGSGPSAAAVSAGAVFVANQHSGDVSVFQIGPEGNLSSRGVAVPAGGAPTSIAVDPGGTYVYVANRVNLVAFNTTSAGPYPLTQLRAYNAGTTPYAVAVDPDGKFVYTTNLDSNDVSGFAISAGGTLLPLGSLSTFGTIGPRSLSVQHIGDPTSIQALSGSATFGAPVEMRGRVVNRRNPGLAPTGSVTFTVNGTPTPNGTVWLDSSGGFGLTFQASTQYLAPGSNLIRIRYNPGPGFEAPAPLELAYIITKAAPKLSVGYSPSAPAAAQSMTITFSAAMAGGRFPGGMAQFAVDGVAAGGPVALANGSATISYTPTPGIHRITAEYQGDSFFLPASAAPGSFHALQPTSIAVTANSTSLVYGEAGRLIATISAAGRTISGTVDFFDAGNRIGTATVTRVGELNRAEIPITFTAVGQHPIAASYSGDIDDFPSNSGAPMTISVRRAATVVTTPVATGELTYGQPITFTTTVTAGPPGSGAPSGIVYFREGTAALGSAILNGGSAKWTATKLAAGTHVILASYSGDTNFLAGTAGASLSIKMAPASPSVRLSAAPTAAVVGQPVSLTAVLNGAFETTGLVEFTVNNVRIGSAPVNTGAASVSYTATSPGAYTFSATYQGDPNHNPATGSSALTVVKGSVMVSTPAIPGKAVVGMPVAISATVSAAAPAAGQPSGLVTFQDGATVLGSARLSNGSATLTTPGLKAGTWSVTASFHGDDNFNSGTSSPTVLSIAKAKPAISMNVSPAPPLLNGQTATLLVTIDTGAGPACSGAVDFFDNGTRLNAASVPVKGGQAQFGPYAVSGAASHSLTATYSGDDNYVSSTNNGNPLALQVNRAAVVLSQPDISAAGTYGQPVTVRVAISVAAPGSGTPRGELSFLDGAAVLGKAALQDGTATFTSTSLGAGNHSLSASFGGDADFLPGTSAAAPVEIAKAAVAISLSAAPSTLVSGQSAHLAVVLDGAPGAGGSLDFFDEGRKINAVPVPVNRAAASLDAVIRGPGTHKLSVAYTGDANHAPANSANVGVTVGQANATVSLPVHAGNAVFGETATFTVSLSPASPATGEPSGAVTFYDGGTAIGTATVTGSRASLACNLSTAGQRSITANYSGDSDFAPSVSSALVLYIAKASAAVALNIAQARTSTVLTAIVTGTGAIQPAGTVHFFNEARLVGAIALTGASATLTIGPASGNFTAVYLGDANFAESRSTVRRIEPSSSLELTASPNPATAGQPVTVTARLYWNGLTPPGGSIEFYEGATRLLSVAAAQQAVLTSVLTTGIHTIDAVYTGDGVYPRCAARFSLTVNRIATPPPGLEADTNTVVVGQTVTLTATLYGGPTGHLQFLDGGVVLASVPLAGGVATLRVSNLPVGRHLIAAQYDGDAVWMPAATRAVEVTVQKASTATAISVAAAEQNAVSVTARVAVAPPAAGLPKGTVQFVDLDSGKVLESATLAAGSATATIPFGADPVTVVAVYVGDDSFTNSSSAPMGRFAVRNAASYLRTPLAPNAWFTIFAAGLEGASVILVDSAGAERLALMLNASPTQLSFRVPSDTARGPATLRVAGASVVVNIGAVSPGIFTSNSNGQGPPAAHLIRVHGDGAQEPPQLVATYDEATATWSPLPLDFTPSEDRLYLVLYGTGMRHRTSPVTVSVDGRSLPILYAGPHPTHPGLDQVNVALPEWLKRSGECSVTLEVDGRVSNPVTLTFQ